MSLVFYERCYTLITFATLATVLLVDTFTGGNDSRIGFYVIYAILLIPFFIVNGALTGSFTDEPIVWYNNAENLGIRLGTIPVEDVFYGLIMILLPVMIAERLKSRFPIPR